MTLGSSYLNAAMNQYYDDLSFSNKQKPGIDIKGYIYDNFLYKFTLKPYLSKEIYIPSYGNILETEDISTAYDQYLTAMKRRRDYVLSWERFTSYVSGSDFFKKGSSYVFGQYNEDTHIFIVTHFAPKSMKEGVSLLQDLAKAKNILFAVTDDLKDMLVRIGFTDLGIEFPRPFGNTIQMKSILVSDPHYILQNLDVILEYYFPHQDENQIGDYYETIYDSSDEY